MPSINDDDRSDLDHNVGSGEGFLTVWDFFHRVLFNRAAFWRLMILIVVLLAGGAVVAVVL